MYRKGIKSSGNWSSFIAAIFLSRWCILYILLSCCYTLSTLSILNENTIQRHFYFTTTHPIVIYIIILSFPENDISLEIKYRNFYPTFFFLQYVLYSFWQKQKDFLRQPPIANNVNISLTRNEKKNTHTQIILFVFRWCSFLLCSHHWYSSVFSASIYQRPFHM